MMDIIHGFIRQAGQVLKLLTACFIFWLALCSSSDAQSLSGIPGYVRIPIATFNKDRTLYFGASFLPHRYLTYTHDQYDAIGIYAGLTFLSFVEIDLRVTRILGLPSGSTHVVDRVPTVRFQILKEKKWIPSTTIGIHDIVTSISSGEARHFGSSYLVLTKNFLIKKLYLNIGTTAGYGTPWFLWKNEEFIGFFGGIALNCTRLDWLTLMVDYDGVIPSAGLRIICFKHLVLMAGILNFTAITGSINYKFNLRK